MSFRIDDILKLKNNEKISKKIDINAENNKDSNNNNQSGSADNDCDIGSHNTLLEKNNSKTQLPSLYYYNLNELSKTQHLNPVYSNPYPNFNIFENADTVGFLNVTGPNLGNNLDLGSYLAKGHVETVAHQQHHRCLEKLNPHHYYNYATLFQNFSVYNHYSKRRNQIRFSNMQTKVLESKFSAQKYLSPDDRKVLAQNLKLTDRQVKTWFQNRRAKWRRNSTNVE